MSKKYPAVDMSSIANRCWKSIASDKLKYHYAGPQPTDLFRGGKMV